MGSTWSCLITIVGLHVQPFSCHMLISPTKEMHHVMTQLNPWLPKSFKLQINWIPTLNGCMWILFLIWSFVTCKGKKRKKSWKMTYLVHNHQHNGCHSPWTCRENTKSIGLPYNSFTKSPIWGNCTWITDEPCI